MSNFLLFSSGCLPEAPAQALLCQNWTIRMFRAWIRSLTDICIKGQKWACKKSEQVLNKILW